MINLQWTGQSSRILHLVVGGSSVFAKDQKERTTGLRPPVCPKLTPKNYRCIITKSSTKPDSSESLNAVVTIVETF